MALPDDVDVARRLRDHFEAGSTDSHADGELRIPTSRYFDEAHASTEVDHLRNMPVVLAHGSVIAEANAFLTATVLGIPVLLVRQGDGSVKGFRNICRHRGGKVETESAGSRRVFTCRYHGWSYDGDGGLRNVPFGEFYPSVTEIEDRLCNGLTPIAVEERHGLIWGMLAEPDPKAIDVATHLGTIFDPHLAELELEKWELYIEQSFELPVNWKLVVEGANDVSHLRFLHPETVGRLIETNTHIFDRDGDHGRLSMARKTMSRLGADDPNSDDARRYVVQSYLFYPNTLLNVQPASYELWSVFPDPESPERSITTIRVLTRPGMTDDEKVVVDKTWDVLLTAARDDDWPMEVWIQEGVRAAASESFLVGSNEQPIQHFHRGLSRHLGLD